MTDVKPTRGSAGQTFLVGETLYLRGLELADARRASAWRDSPFPLPAEQAEELLKKEAPDDDERQPQRLVACQIADDEPVGAVLIEVWGWWTGWVTPWADPALGAAGMAVKAELVRLVVPWLLTEREMLTVCVNLDDDERPVIEAAEAIGMRPACRLREARWRDGARHDRWTYEALHPVWLARFGEPEPAAIDAPPPVVGRRQLPEPPANPPRNAVLVGERVYLRPLEREDAEQAARWSRLESETFFDARPIRSPIAYARWNLSLAERDPPSWLRFAIALRETDELIGANGLAEIDWVHRTAETESEIFRAQHRGHGLGTEAKHLLLAYAFDRLGLHMVRSFVWAPNTRSAAALRKQGYRDAGRISWAGAKDGQMAPDLAFDLLAEEWRAQTIQTAAN